MPYLGGYLGAPFMHFSTHKASAALTICFLTKLRKFGSISQAARPNENHSVQPNTVEPLSNGGICAL
jgi:hypothetical protein